MKSAPQRLIAWKTSRAPSTTAIQNAMRMRYRRNQRPPRVVPCSSAGCSITALTLPAWCRDPGLAAVAQGGVRRDRFALLGEQAVHRRACAGYIRPERAIGSQLLGQGRGRQVVGRQKSEVVERQGSQELGSPVLEALFAAERVVHRRGRLLSRAVRQHEEHPVLLREVEPPQRRPVSLAQLRTRRQEEGDVGAESRRQLLQRAVRKRTPKRPVREAQRGSGVRAA